MKTQLLVAGLGCLSLAACTKDDSSGTPTDPGSTTVSVACAEPTGEVQEFDAMKLYFEYQSTDNDTGIHGLMGMSGWSELCVYSPTGEQILAAKPQGNLHGLTMADLFFESREPPNSEVSQAEILAMFPAGDYAMRGLSYDGKSLEGDAWLTHDIPKPPVVTFPTEGGTVDPSNFVVTWEPVTETVAGEAVDITAYEVIVTDDRDEAEDEHGNARPVASIHVPANATSLTIPSEFLISGIEYELEIIALEESGNQTITVVFFETM